MLIPQAIAHRVADMVSGPPQSVAQEKRKTGRMTTLTCSDRGRNHRQGAKDAKQTQKLIFGPTRATTTHRIVEA
jgi:hypothetical protein